MRLKQGHHLRASKGPRCQRDWEWVPRAMTTGRCSEGRNNCRHPTFPASGSNSLQRTLSTSPTLPGPIQKMGKGFFPTRFPSFWYVFPVGRGRNSSVVTCSAGTVSVVPAGSRVCHQTVLQVALVPYLTNKNLELPNDD